MKDLQQILKGKVGYDTDYNQNITNANENFTELKNAVDNLKSSGGSSVNIAPVGGHNNVIYFDPKAGTIIIGFKYGADKDFFIEFKKCGVNSILGMYKFYEAANTNEEVDADVMRTKTLLKTSGTDFVGPVIVKSLASSGTNADATSAFTGGWHGYKGDQTGNATAKTTSYVLYLNGEKQNYTNVVNKKVDRIDLKVINYIQAYNTKLETGTGAYILEETTIYTIIKNTVNVSTTLKALDNCIIETYYGLQSSNSEMWNVSITYPLGSSQNRINFADTLNSTSGSHAEYAECRRWVVKGSSGHALMCFVDKTFGMGKSPYLGATEPNIFTQSYSDANGTKTYYNFIKNYGSDGLHLGKSKMISWRGGYVFCNVKNNPSSLDLLTDVYEYNRHKLIFDCVSPCGNFLINDDLIGKNLKVLVNKGNADITQTANGISILNNAKYGCLEMDVIDTDITE